MKEIVAPVHLVVCDWCKVTAPYPVVFLPNGYDSEPKWASIPAQSLGGPVGWQWHACPDCIVRLLPPDMPNKQPFATCAACVGRGHVPMKDGDGTLQQICSTCDGSGLQ